ncbi:MaoC family dehydratase N-terminal domain-containing protein [Desulfobacterota bacterium AH_259_B03_O07]|nr:MaoC family dehydratase N-terminal domain-containing protein [Desulfobacterota bacterium AH_259_B03_O07]
MGLNREFVGHEYEPIIHTVSEEEIREYAWAIGARNLAYFNYNGALSPTAPKGMAPPSYAVVYELPILERLWSDPKLHGGEEQARKNVLMLVHGDQQMRFYKPIRPGDKLEFKIKISNIEDKGSGELLVFNVVTNDEAGDKVVESDWGLFIRGIGSGQKSKQASKKREAASTENPQLAFRKTIRVPNDITYRYAEAAHDQNPIHVEEEVAKKAGLKGIVVHGLCTMSMAMRAIIECYIDSDPTKLLQLGVRFASPVYPGDILIADGWEIRNREGNTLLGFEVTRLSDDVKVIKRGTAEVSV